MLAACRLFFFFYPFFSGVFYFFLRLWFLFYFLMASRETFIKKGEGGAQPNISRVKLVEHLIPLPPLNEQKRIVERIETLFEQL